MVDDIELGDQRGERKSPWRPTSITFRRSTTLGTALTSRVPTTEYEFFGNLPTLTSEEIKGQWKLIIFIVGNDMPKGPLATACQWYSQYLQMKFTETWHLLAPSLEGLEDSSKGPRAGDLVVVYDFVYTIAQLLSTRRKATLVEIVDKLDNDNLLKPQGDEERAKPNQIVFAIVGWLSMLYEAVSHPKPDKLEVRKTSTSSSGQRNDLVTRKYLSFGLGFEYIDVPLYTMLGKFGYLIPMARIHSIRQPGFSHHGQSGIVQVHSVCFDTLHQIAGLKIEWVSSLALHLELDSGKKTLKLFQFPSFCRMMMVDRKKHLLSRLLNDHADSQCEDVNAADIPTDEFFEEILRSYRLIFGQDERSWKGFTKMLTGLEESHEQGMTSWACDPLLRVLCGQSSSSTEARYIYEELDNNQPTTYYTLDEFPFFGKRLMELAEFDNQHQPQTVMSLLNDRRDIAARFNLRSTQLLVLFATVTILLMVLSLCFQIWQVVLAKQQLQQGSSPSFST